MIHPIQDSSPKDLDKYIKPKYYGVTNHKQLNANVSASFVNFLISHFFLFLYKDRFV